MLYDKRWELDEDGKLLWDAADYIEVNGWCQGNLQIGDAVCVVGAVFAVLKVAGPGEENYDRAVAAMKRLGIPRVTDWNDNPKRTKEQVVARMRKEAFAKR